MVLLYVYKWKVIINPPVIISSMKAKHEKELYYSILTDPHM